MNRSLTTWAGAALLIAASTGCSSEDIAQDKQPVTYYQDIAPLLTEKCGSCHVEDSIAPFTLSSYESASSLAPLLLEAVEDGSMPPWLAQDTDECQPEYGFKNDLRLSESQKQMLRDWVAAGTPEGDANKAAVLPTAPALSIEDPSVTMKFRKPYTVDGKVDDFQCFVLDPGNTEQVWITEAQLNPDNELVDHHGLVFLDFSGASEQLADADGRFPCFNTPDTEGYLVATWTPGAVPMVTPATSGMPLPAGARIVVQMHFHPTGGGPEVDQSSVDLKWTTTQPEWEVAQALVGNFGKQNDKGYGLQPGPNDSDGPAFIIPAGVTDHVETQIYQQDVPFEFPIFSVGTHMHYVGTDMKIDLVKKQSGDKSCLVQTPAWDFNWQRVYDLDAPIDELPTIASGDELHMRCSYNNSMSNPFVLNALMEQGIDAPKDVVLGEETLDEMCLGLFGIAMPPGVIQQLYGGE